MPPAFAAAVEQRLTTFVDERADELAPVGIGVEPLLEAARQAVRGGKRLRPAFCYWGWRAAGGSAVKTAPIATVAAAVELVHAGALAHDDVMDSSAYRRGHPTAHRWFAQRRRASGSTDRPGRRSTDPDRFGRNAAICLGDLLLVWSAQLFADADLRAATAQRSRRFFDLLRSEVISGQFLDVHAQSEPASGAADAMRVLRYKSAKYTVERPLQMGAASAKGDRRLDAALSSYGVPLGEAFQLRDDVLSVFGEPAATGKAGGDDIREGKRTLLVARALDRATKGQRQVLSAALGNPDLTDAQLADVREVLTATGARDAVETVITELAAAARAALPQAPIETAEARQALGALVDTLTRRTR